MAGYTKPKTKLHREFLYLNHETVINSLSAVEAGKIDEIIQKASEAREGGLEGTIGYGPLKATGGKKKSADIHEEMVRTRTIFSSFDAWHKYLEAAGAFGTLDNWDEEIREEIGIGDTVQFTARVSLAPLHRVFSAFIAFSNEAANPDSALKRPTAEVAGLKKTARMMSGWMRGKSESRMQLVQIAPFGIQHPRIMAGLDEAFLIAGAQGIEGEFTVIGQVEALLKEDEDYLAIRVIRDSPPTALEANVVTEGMKNMIEPAKALGIEMTEDDFLFNSPTVILHPIAIFR